MWFRTLVQSHVTGRRNSPAWKQPRCKHLHALQVQTSWLLKLLQDLSWHPARFYSLERSHMALIYCPVTASGAPPPLSACLVLQRNIAMLGMYQLWKRRAWTQSCSRPRQPAVDATAGYVEGHERERASPSGSARG